MKQRKYPSPRPKAVDLFCGAGGMSLGFEQAGFDIALGVDADGHHCAVHHRNFPNSKTLCMSVADLTGKQIREVTGLDEIDVVFGGPPCQGFSNMGHRHSDDPRNTLVDQFARVVMEVRPKAFVMENVPAMLAGDTRPILDRLIATLERAGYAITQPLQKLTAVDFGVPQARTRLFVLGILAKLNTTFSYPVQPCTGQPALPTVFEAIADLPRIEDFEQLYTVDHIEYQQPAMKAYARVARGMIRDPSDFSIPRIWNSTRCTGCTRTRHAAASVEMYAATPPGGTVPGHKLPRLDPLGVAPTLRAGSDSTRGSYTAPRPIHPYVPRCITAREAARLHGYPDWFSFYPTKWHAYKQIGNSVCPPVARAVGTSLIRALKVRYAGKTPEPIQLADLFPLPAHRPRQSRRLPQVREYPPVINWLFNRAFDRSTMSFRETRFSFADVRQAIAATKAKLPATRDATFVDELARSRNVRTLLAACLSEGYSIAVHKKGEWIGEFVPVGTPGSIEVKEELSAKARDLSAVVSVPEPISRLANLREEAGALIQIEAIRRRLWGDAVVKVETVDVEIDLLGERNSQRVRITRPTGTQQVISIIVGSQSNVPPRSRVLRVAREEGVAEVIVLTPITTKHLLVCRFNKCLTQPCEADRAVFSFDAAISTKNSRKKPAGALCG